MKHGANIYKYAKQIGCSSDAIIDFSSNINLYQPKATLKITNAEITKYAQSHYKRFKKVIAQKYAVATAQIALFNGATAGIYALLHQLKQKKVVLYAPLYGEYEKAALESQKKILKINRLQNLDAKVPKKSIVIFVNPSTPDGKFYALETLFSYWKKQKCTIILDESFLEFEAHPSLRGMINEYEKLYIVQSFSKFYSCAGVRIGAIFAHKKSVEKLQTPLWNISSLDVKFLQVRLQESAFDKRSLQLHAQQKEELRAILQKSQLFEEIVQSDANFILTKSSQAEVIFTHLLQHKILTRTCGSFDFLSNAYLRFAVKDKDSHRQLKKALADFVENHE